MNVTRTLILSTCLVISAVFAEAQAPRPSTEIHYGEVSGGFPSWEERTLHQLMNRARVDPAAELAACVECSPAELSGCYGAMPPLTVSLNLNEAARFHSESMSKMNFFGPDTPCVLRADIAAVYPALCDASFACSCTANGTTSQADRLALFSATGSAESIAYGIATPFELFSAWLLEPAPAAPCASTAENEHRWSILKNPGPGTGNGVFHGPLQGCGADPCPIATQNFGAGPEPIANKMSSGSHWTPDGQRSGPVVEFWANWFDSLEPFFPEVIVDGAATFLSLARGTPQNGAYTITLDGLSEGCHRYYFSARSLPVGYLHTYPSNGSFGIGDESCPEWIPTRRTRVVKGDLNADGSADLIWRHGVSGANAYWLLDGATVIDGGFLMSVPDMSWELGGVGDFNVDRQTDLVWFRRGGNDPDLTTVWFMNGVNYVSQMGIYVWAQMQKINGLGDFYGEGFDKDLLSRDPVSGDNIMMVRAGSGGDIIPVRDLSWDMIGSGDVDGDGKTDIVWWNHESGDVAVWLMDGMTRVANLYIGRVADTGWRVSAIGDFDGDGRADLAWHNIDGDVALWFLDGATVIGGAYLGRVVDANWKLVGPK